MTITNPTIHTDSAGDLSYRCTEGKLGYADRLPGTRRRWALFHFDGSRFHEFGTITSPQEGLGRLLDAGVVPWKPSARRTPSTSVESLLP